MRFMHSKGKSSGAWMLFWRHFKNGDKGRGFLGENLAVYTP
jgi:hypothetical protein